MISSRGGGARPAKAFKRSRPFQVADMIAAWSARYLPATAQAEYVLPPVTAGGDDAGPGPYDLLLAALGTCTSMTMRLYADRKGIAADRFAVRLAHRRVHAEDCLDCETEKGDIGEISKEITIEGDISEADRVKLFEIAAKCPVHKTLTHEIKIRSKLVQ